MIATKRRVIAFITLLVGVCIPVISFAEVTTQSKAKNESKVKIEMGQSPGTASEEFYIDDSLETPTGALVIKAVSSFNFGSQEKNNNGEVKLGEKGHALIEGINKDGKELNALGIEVHDLRGTGKGWLLTAYLNSIKNEENELLTHFQLEIPTEEVTTKSATEKNIPEANNVILDYYGPEEAVCIMEAKEGSGMGKITDIFKWKDSSANGVTLNVPITARVGTYIGSITWSLADAPK